MDFIDIPGALGASYRFRIWPQDGGHLPVAGNFVVVRAAVARVEVLAIGVTNDLSRARSAAAAKDEDQVVTRLNVARATREAEHDDMVAQYPKARVIVEKG